MKKIVAIAIGSFVLTTAIHAQMVVYDPTVNIEQILSQAENIAKYIQMIDNQVSQINTLNAQFQAFGNPASLVNITGANPLVGDLNKAVTGQSLGTIQTASQGIEAMTFDANGLYHNIGKTFQTPSGNEVQRQEGIYRQHAALQNATQNYTNVFNDATQRRLSLRADIAVTIQKLQNATTASEVQKLTGVLIGLDADLADTDKEIDHAAGLTLVQDAENRNDADKQNKARLEEQQTEFSEALTNYRTAFHPVAEKPNFPAQ